MRNLVITSLVLLPSLATIAHAAQSYRAPRQNNLQGNYRELTPAEASATYSGCNEVRQRGLAPLRRGQPGYRPWMDGDNDGLACEPVRR